MTEIGASRVAGHTEARDASGMADLQALATPMSSSVKSIGEAMSTFARKGDGLRTSLKPSPAPEEPPPPEAKCSTCDEKKEEEESDEARAEKQKAAALASRAAAAARDPLFNSSLSNSLKSIGESISMPARK